MHTDELSIIILNYLEIPERYILWRRFGNPIFLSFRAEGESEVKVASVLNSIAAAFVVRTGWASALPFVDLDAAVIEAFHAKDYALVRLYIANGANKLIPKSKLQIFSALKI